MCSLGLEEALNFWSAWHATVTIVANATGEMFSCTYWLWHWFSSLCCGKVKKKTQSHSMSSPALATAPCWLHSTYWENQSLMGLLALTVVAKRYTAIVQERCLSHYQFLHHNTLFSAFAYRLIHLSTWVATLALWCQWETLSSGMTTTTTVCTNVWMGRTARASSAATRSVKKVAGRKDGSTSTSVSWIPTLVFSSPLPSCSSTSSTGSATSTSSQSRAVTWGPLLKQSQSLTFCTAAHD